MYLYSPFSVAIRVALAVPESVCICHPVIISHWRNAFSWLMGGVLVNAFCSHESHERAHISSNMFAKHILVYGGY